MTFSMNAVGRRVIAAVRKGYLPVVLVTLLAVAVEVGMNIVVQAVIVGGGIDPGEGGRNLGTLSLVTINIAQWFHAVHTAAISEIAIRADIGRPVDPGRIALASLKNSVPVLLLIVVYSVGCILGGALLIVPGLFFATAFSIVVPVYVGERKDWIATFRRAFQLTRGHRWQIFALWVAIGLATYTLSHALSGQAPLSELRALMPQIFPDVWPEDGTPWLQYSYEDHGARALLSLIAMATLSVRVLLNTGIYLTLRGEKDANSADALAEVFA